MFDNAGDKLGAVAMVYFGIATVASIIGAIVLLFNGLILGGIVVLAVGILSAYLGALPMVALGEVHMTNRQILHELKKVSNQTGTISNTVTSIEKAEAEKNPPIATLNTDGSWQCTCGRKHQSYVTSCVCGTNKRDVLNKK